MSVAIIGLEDHLAVELRDRVRSPERKVLLYPTLPKAYTDQGVFKVEHPSMEGLWIEPEAIIYYSYFPESSGIRKAMAMGRQPTWPSVRRTILHDDKDLSLLRVGGADDLPRGYVPKGLVPSYNDDVSRVFKWGNAHCGEGKLKIDPSPQRGVVHPGAALKIEGYGFIAKQDTLVEPFVVGESYRVLLIGKKVWVICYESRDWRKNVNSTQTVIEPERRHQTMITWARVMAQSNNLPVVGVDFILEADGSKHFLELNCYPEIPEYATQDFLELAAAWVDDPKKSLW